MPNTQAQQPAVEPGLTAVWVTLNGLEFCCHMEHEPADAENDWPERWSLFTAYIGMTEVTDWLNPQAWALLCDAAADAIRRKVAEEIAEHAIEAAMSARGL